MIRHDAPTIILASASPRRRELLARLGLECEFVSPDIDERAIEAKSPREYAIKTAYAKALAAQDGRDQGLVIAADTIVVLDGAVYPKPDDEAHAREMLSALAGREHTVITGVAVAETGRGTLLDAAETLVRMRALDPSGIADYVATGEPLDKAGAYAAQGIGRTLIESIRGDYYNVVGLPLELLLRMLDDFLETHRAIEAYERLRREDPNFIPSL